MISYRGDKYVTGKKFKINNESYTFKRKSKNGLVFEASDSKIKVFTESELEKSENKRIMMEKVKQEVSKLSIKEGRVLSKKELKDIIEKYQVQK